MSYASGSNMRVRPGVRESAVSTLPLPAHVSAGPLMGQRGKLLNQVQQMTGANIHYSAEDHRFEIRGRHGSVGAAADLLARTLRHYEYTGLQLCRKQTHNVLSSELSAAGELLLLPGRRRATVHQGGALEGFILATPATPSSSPSSPSPSASTFADPHGPAPTRHQQPGASTSAPSGGGPGPQPLFRAAAELDSLLAQLLGAATEVALRHPADCDRFELRFYLGKLMVTEPASSQRVVPLEALLGWSYPKSGRAVFETALPQDTIRSLDRHLTAHGFQPTAQAKSASLHLETSISWVQYHPTFAVRQDGSLALTKLEASGCKPMTVAVVGPAGQLDVRMRFVATVEYGPEDRTAVALRAREAEFALVDGVQVTVPRDLASLDLTLSSVRVKLKRVYTSTGPLPPPPSQQQQQQAQQQAQQQQAQQQAQPAAAEEAAPPAAAAKKTRAKRTARGLAPVSEAAPPPPPPPPPPPAAPPLPAVSLKVAVAAVVDNLGGKRLEVTVSCPELNDQLMAMHRAREAGPEAAALLEAQLRAVLAHLDHLRANVAFEP